MIVLDTNVLSELIRPEPDARVLGWLDRQASAEVAMTSIAAADLLYGVARLPEGHRKNTLTAAVRGLIADDFRGRVEPFDAPAAEHYAEVVAARERAGRPISTADAQIASICRRANATLATRNSKDFQHTGVTLLDPWDSGST
jgi:hypothetical protein